MIPNLRCKRELGDQGNMNKLVDFFYPPRCQLCGTVENLGYDGQLCMACAADFPLNHTACQHCAIPMSHVDTSVQRCARCLKAPPEYDLCWSPFIYAQPLEWMIQQLKFNDKLSIAPLLTKLMAENLPDKLYKNNSPDVVIPMPLHPQRLKQRGFNQSYLLVKKLAKQLKLPIDLSACQRVVDTEHQTGKNAKQRRQNIRNAFTFDNACDYRHVLIFDDVMTTGSSVAELTKTIKRSGVKRVDVWCLARAEK